MCLTITGRQSRKPWFVPCKMQKLCRSYDARPLPILINKRYKILYLRSVKYILDLFEKLIMLDKLEACMLFMFYTSKQPLWCLLNVLKVDSDGCASQYSLKIHEKFLKII